MAAKLTGADADSVSESIDGRQGEFNHGFSGNDEEPISPNSEHDEICYQCGRSGDPTELTSTVCPAFLAICSGLQCDEKAKSICMLCNAVFCKPCAEIHLLNKKTHSPSLIKNYPIEDNE